MSNQPSERVQGLRSRANAERELTSKLNASVSDPYLSQQLKNASNLLDDVERFFLDEHILQEPRSPAEWSYWLSGTDKALQHAVQFREYVEGIIRQFGPDVRTFPS
jgi:hypothetical protein